MDVVADTEIAITTYEATTETDTGMLYLQIYGLLQAMYVQQDGLENMVRALDGNNDFKIESEPEAKYIRQVRHDTVGHPTKQGGTKVKNGRPGEQISHFLVRHSMSNTGFTLMRTSNLRDVQFIEISITDLIRDNRALVLRVLLRTKDKLEVIEMEHRKRFRGKKLVDHFSNQASYYFEKIYSAIHSPSYGNTPIGEIGLKIVRENLAAFRAAIEERGILNKQSHYDHDLAEIEYPLAELDKYFQHDKTSLLSDPRAAAIFAHFGEDKLEELKIAAEDLDDEYDEDISSTATP